MKITPLFLIVQIHNEYSNFTFLQLICPKSKLPVKINVCLWNEVNLGQNYFNFVRFTIPVTVCQLIRFIIFHSKFGLTL